MGVVAEEIFRRCVTENVVRDTALSLGLVDIKVCAIDDTWSALKLVIPLEQRARPSLAKRGK